MDKNDQTPTPYAEAVLNLKLEVKDSSIIQDYWGETALFGAAKAGNRAKCLQLLMTGADPNVRNNDGQTALMWADIWGQGDVGRDTTSILLAAGADPDIRDHDGNTALIMALTRRNNNQARILIGSGADVNIVGKNKQTALMLTCSDDIACMLIEAGADIDMVDNYGNTALVYAGHMGLWRAVRMMMCLSKNHTDQEYKQFLLRST